MFLSSSSDITKSVALNISSPPPNSLVTHNIQIFFNFLFIYSVILLQTLFLTTKNEKKFIGTYVSALVFTKIYREWGF